MISRDALLIYLFDEILQLRQAGGVNEAAIEALQKKLEESSSKRRDSP